ncbi:unnamed protein product [Didymodactylos carnosus]|uniref:Uncharacterized protein n=1 Tax=Didymodactylos carnosus TaxID=1234261 RepID=A0A815A064_9BILA|nr:unnamed protein product [Didymodactylos carnosus]CAF1386459.1 unnamed protein product [Didymodactylos carnosus]CAF4019457.1 unnamed protein product [Didymodactylos carnosus]CAF4194304.1 unnamed protein product [Didymodactylos carnosus]
MPRSRSPTLRSHSPPDYDSRDYRGGGSGYDNGHNNRDDQFRIHIAELSKSCRQKEIEKTFESFGPILEVWHAQASCFAFVVYKYKEDAQKAVDAMDGRSFNGTRVRVTWARPRIRNRPRRYDPSMRCYKCGQRGHFSRDCDGVSHSRISSSRRKDDDRGGRDDRRQHNRSSRSRSPIQQRRSTHQSSGNGQRRYSSVERPRNAHDSSRRYNNNNRSSETTELNSRIFESFKEEKIDANLKD